MKKRVVCCLATIVLLCGSLAAARAEVWFTEPGTVRLHRDPFCRYTGLGTSLHAPALWFESIDAIVQQGENTLCTACAGVFPAADEAAMAQSLFYNPEGGRWLHAIRDCSAVDAAYLPLSGEWPAARAEDSDLELCPHCMPVSPQALQNVAQVWNTTLEEKAALLPGVWTLPSENAIAPEAALAAAEGFIQAKSLLKTPYLNGLYTDCVYHYDTADKAPLAREHYRVLVTNVLQEPIALVYVDALTGEVLGASVTEGKTE